MSLPPPASAAEGDGTERAAQRFAFLAAAGEAIAGSLDHEETLQRLARLAVPAMGDFCLVDIIEEDGRVRRVAAAHASPAKLDLVHELADRFPPFPGSPSPAGRVIASGRTELLADVDLDAILRHTVDDDHARLIRGIGVRSHLAVPLRSRGHVLGVLSLGITESDRRYGDEDVLLAEEIARRAAMAIENARLYRAAQAEIARRREAESELRLSERRFRAILEQSPLSTQILAPDGRTLGVNAAFEALWGVGVEDLRGYSVLTDPQLEAKGIAPLLRRAFAGEAVRLPTIAYDVEQTLPGRSRAEPGERWVSAQAYPVRDDAGVVREVVLVHIDVTDLRLGEARVRASEEQLHRALGAAQMVVWDWNLASGLIECSDNALAFFGMRVAQAEDFLRTIHPQDLPHVQAASARALDGEAAFVAEFRLDSPDGRERWVHSRGEVERDAAGQPVRFLGVTLEISELKRAEETTRVLADAGRTLGASLDIATTLTDLAHVVVPRLADWYAIDLLREDGGLERVAVSHPDPERVAQAREIFERYPPRRDADYGAWHVIRTGQPEWAAQIDDAVLQRAAQDAGHLALLRALQLRSYIVVPLVARDTVIGALTLVHAESGRRYTAADVDVALDIARRAAAAVDNARLVAQMQAEHRRKDEFLATLAHELRNPLAPLRTGLSVLAASPDPDVAARTRSIMERQLAQMVRLIDDLLDLSRVTRGTIELRTGPVAMADVVATAVETSRPLIDAAGVVLGVELPAGPVCIEGDATRLAQVLTNLLNNAAKFTPRGGRVELRVSREGDEVRVDVEDTGVGIAPSRLDQVFEMFARGPAADGQGGLGIGLTLSRRLAELHGGSLHAYSAGLGEGSRFTLRLPAQACAGDAGALGAPTPPPKPTHHRRVMVVDDNTDAATTLATVLELHGHHVRTAGSAAEAVSLAAEFAPEVAFLDIGLPDRSGHELARALRSSPSTAGACLVAVTGWGRDEDRARSRASGFDGHLTKPVDLDAVLACVAALDHA